MKYEFHVGDYVEMIGGFVGWISAMRGDEYIIVVDKNNNTCGYYIPQEIRYFVRIGQYDFTKENESKIKPLVKSWILDDTDDKDECYFDSCEIIKKINELVEAVNRLEEKVNGMAQS